MERLAAPVRTKTGTLAVDENGKTLSATEAIAMSITQNAIRGDLAAASFIRNITRSQGNGSDELKEEYHRRKADAVACVKTQLEKEGLWTGQQIEAERIAATMVLIEDLEAQMQMPGYEDIVIEYNRAGTATQRVNPIHELLDRYVKLLDSRLKQTRIDALQRINNQKLLTRK